MSTDRSHREGNELVELDDPAASLLEPLVPEPVIANDAAANAAAAQRQAAEQDEAEDTESLHRRVFTGDQPPGPPPPRSWTVGGGDANADPGAPGTDDEPLAAPAPDAWSGREGPPPPIAASFLGEDSWAVRPRRAAPPPGAGALGASWARPVDPRGVPAAAPPKEACSWARAGPSDGLAT